MSEANQRIALIFVFVFAIGCLRLATGYATWEPEKDITSALTIASAAGVAAKFLVGKSE